MMSLRIRLFICSLIALVHISFSQQQEDVLLTVDDKPILASEFMRVYNKNLDLVKDENQKDIDAYLELFVNYQLKLSEARRLKLDEDPKYKREFTNYKRQLTKNYLSESKVTDELVKEAYERMQQDIKAVHILIKLDATAKDTITTYNRLLELRDRVIKEGFEAVKADVHNGSTVFAEDLGYFSAFKMVYDFETMAYNTKVGEVSMPFRTDFGYHVVKVLDKRASRGTISAAHIMVSLKQKDSLLDPEVRINEIYKKLNQGESFESLAKQFSDDRSSSRNGGQLSPFKSGQLSSIEFENVAFGLKEDGEVSPPFKTQYGWHIVKRISKKELEPYEQAKAILQNRVKRDSRSKLINSAMVKELKGKYTIVENKDALDFFATILDENYFLRSWRPTDFKGETVILTINKTTFDYTAFVKHLRSVQRNYLNKKIPVASLLEKEYNTFVESSVLKYREDNLELENQDFADILREYRDGLLLFEFMEREVWNKASKDSTGLQSFYDKNSNNYKWGDRIKIVLASSADKSTVEKVSQLLEGTSQEDIKAQLNSDKKQNVIFTTGTYNVNDPILPQGLDIKTGVSKVYEHNNAFHVINIEELLPSRVKTLEEAKGSVINDYQMQIEDDWLNGLKNQFKVVINENVLKSIKSRVGN